MATLRRLRRFLLVLVAVATIGLPVQVGTAWGAETEVVGVAAAPNGGHWTVRADGVVSAGGGAPHHGDLAGRRLARPIVNIAATPTGQGYWLVAADGGIFSFGDARFQGSTGAMRLNQPVVGMAPTPSGRGYWLVAADGGIFSFGDARFYGSTGAMRLNEPVVGMASTATGAGYWLVASDGGVFSFGDASFFGAAAASAPGKVRAMARRPAGGYLLAAVSGAVLAFGPGGGTIVDPGLPIRPAAPSPSPSPSPGAPSPGAARTSGAVPEAAPASAVRVAPGQSIQAAVDAAAPGTTFLLRAGVHRNQRIQPKDRMTFLGEPGTVLDGGLTTPHAFVGGAVGVRIRGLVVQRYAPPLQQFAVFGYPGTGWVVEWNEIRDNTTGGARVPDRGVLRNNYVHHNGQIGVGTYQASDSLVEGNEIAYNNPANLTDYTWEAGGSKFVATTNLVIRGNDVHDNVGPGLWMDIDNRNTLIEGNRVYDNAASGIFEEISYGAVIRGNIVERNGLTGNRHGGVYGAGILVTESSNVEVYGNTVRDNQAGIMAKQSPRGSGAYGPYAVSGLYVHDNVVTSPSQSAGLVQYVGDDGFFSARGNRFERNRYIGPSSFAWLNRTLDRAGWQAAGQDQAGSFA